MSYRERPLISRTTLWVLFISLAAVGTGKPDWMTIGEAAEYLNVSERFIRRLITERRVGFHHFGRFIRLSPKDLDAFAEAGHVDARV